MMETHVSDEYLISFCDDPRSAAEVAEHVRTCVDCSEKLSFYRTLRSDLKDSETWRIEEEYRTHRGGAAVAAFAARIESEDAAAFALAEEILQIVAREPDRNFAPDARFRTGGMVRALEKVILEQRLIDPFLAERLSRVVCDIAESLADDFYPGKAVYELRGRAWVLRAVELQNLNRYPEAEEATACAERAYQQLADPGAGIAAVMLTRAIQCFRLNRCADGLPYAKAAAAEYESRGDTKKYVEAKEVAACLLYKMGDPIAAMNIVLEAMKAADEFQDAEMRARVRHNLSLYYRSIGDFETSSRYLMDALGMAEGLHMKATVAVCRWSAGILALARADFAEAEKVLRGAIDALQEVGDELNAAEAKIDLGEALLMLGRPQEIDRLCTEAEAFFEKVGLVTGRLEAVRFLKTAAANHMLHREDIKHVRTYLDQSRERPDTPFVPPQRRGSGSEH